VVLDGLVGTATVTTQGPHRRLRHDAKGGDCYLATSGDLDLATSGDSFMATEITTWPPAVDLSWLQTVTPRLVGRC